MIARRQRQLWLSLITGLLFTSAGCSGCPWGNPKPQPEPAVAVPQPARTATQPQRPPTPREFVDGIYPHGVPYDGAIQLGLAAEKELISLLDQPEMRDNRGNILITLGMLGTDAGWRAIKQTIESGTGQLSTQDFLVKMDGIMALGFTTNAGRVPEALVYLRSGVNPLNWSDRVRWQMPTSEPPGAQLRKQCIAALGISGNDDAYTFLKTLVSGESFDALENAAVNQALTTNRQVKNLGMSGYYKTVLKNR